MRRKARRPPALGDADQAFWRKRLGADPAVVGQNITIEGKPYTVVGVLRPDFRWPGVETAGRTSGLPEILVTIVPPRGQRGPPQRHLAGRRRARLRDGVSLEQGQTRLDALAARLGADFPVDQLHVGVQAVPLRDAQVGPCGVLLVLWGAVVLLLVLTCANVANLLLARAVSREHEMAVRSALGATRKDLIQKLLGESLVLGLAGAVLGWLSPVPPSRPSPRGFLPPSARPLRWCRTSATTPRRSSTSSPWRC